MQRAPRGRVAALAAPAALLALLAALVIGAAVWHRPLLTATGLWVDGGQPTVSPTFFDGPSATPSQESGSGVIGAATPAPDGKPPTSHGLAAAIAGVEAKGLGTTSGIVIEAATGRVLWSRAPQRPQIPASTLKILTSVAALDALGPEHRFTTRTVNTAPGSVVLVGGGDPYLTSRPAKAYPHAPSSATLARQTADALKKQGTTSITLGYDDSLFTGPAWHPSWPDGYHDQVTTISALWLDQGRPEPVDPTGKTPPKPPSRTPAATAAQQFAAQLRAQGITVAKQHKAVRTDAKATYPKATELARLESLPVRTLVQETLLHSDNSAAEVLLRQVGIATGNGGSFAGGAKGVQQSLTKLDAWTPGSRMVDGSGLSRSNLVSADVLGGVLAASSTTARLRPVMEAMPAAGVSGTLANRFYTPEAAAGRGWVNAKTGTLTKVATLAGHTRTRSGDEVVFALMANNQTEEWGARTWLDSVATTITSCGC